MHRLASFVLLLGLSTTSCGSPAPPEAPLPPPALPTPAPPVRAPGPGARNIEIELLEGPVPWTHLEVRNSPDSFQFAIVTDRTGGMRPGVFASAVPKINLLHPEFVMSVGDLIEGYTEDVARVERDWNEFDALVKGLNAPFFYVVGNHDLTNETMSKIWHERYGPTYYSFVYRDVLFVCLDTMDGGLHKISAAQLAWLEQTLGQHTNARWTLLFMHTPLWDDRPDTQSPRAYGDAWQRIERLLGTRQFTAFAGHHHRYVKHERNDRRLFTLATTGGGSGLRGPAYGEFDHIMWVTMTADGPLIANLMLDGIGDENVRTEEQRDIHYSLLNADTLKPNPVYFSGRFHHGQSSIRLRNDRDLPLKVRLSTSGTPALSVAPAETTLDIPPNSLIEHQLEVTAPRSITEALSTIPLDWHAQTTTSAGTVFKISGRVQIPVVKLIEATRAAPRPTIDGNLQDWGRLPIVVNEPAQILYQPHAWQGPEDNRFSVGVRYDRDYLYLAVQVLDDSVSAKPGIMPWQQDGIEIRVDARPDPERSHSAGRADGRDFLLLASSPNDGVGEPWLVREPWIYLPQGVELACVQTSRGFDTEVAIPRQWLIEVAGEDANLLRLNIAVNDADQDGQSQSWWWPDWRTPRDLPGSGTIHLGP